MIRAKSDIVLIEEALCNWLADSGHRRECQSLRLATSPASRNDKLMSCKSLRKSARYQKLNCYSANAYLF
jgi:hypothetical protein